MGPRAVGHETSELRRSSSTERVTSIADIVKDTGPRVGQYHHRFTWRLGLAVLVAALGGLITGYDLGVFGGVSVMESFQAQFFPSVLENSQARTSNYCSFNDQLLSFTGAVVYLTGMAGALASGWLAQAHGRLSSFWGACIFVVVGAAASAASTSTGMLLGARCVLGVGFGIGTHVFPIYLAEVSPAPIRGACTIAYSICVQAGLLVAQGLNQGLKDWEHGWQLSLGLAGVPAVLIMAALPFMPETPNSLVERGRLEAGLRMLVLLRGVPVDKVRAELDDIKEAAVRTRAVGNTWLNLTRRKFRPQLVGAIGLPIANQFTGIMAVTGWSPSLFMSMGASGSFPFVAAMIISGISLLAACVADVLVDRMGRRKLFTIGGIVMGITQLVEGGLIAVNVPPSGEITQSTSLVHSLLAISCVFQAGFGVSWAPLGWLVPVEIQHLETRSSGYAVSIAVNYGFAFLVVECFQSMLCGMQYGVFIFYGLLNFINIALILTFLPETARVPIEELHSLFRNHWYWRRMAPSEAEEEVEAASSAAAGKLEVTGEAPGGKGPSEEQDVSHNVAQA